MPGVCSLANEFYCKHGNSSKVQSATSLLFLLRFLAIFYSFYNLCASNIDSCMQSIMFMCSPHFLHSNSTLTEQGLSFYLLVSSLILKYSLISILYAFISRSSQKLVCHSACFHCIDLHRLKGCFLHELILAYATNTKVICLLLIVDII